MRADQAERNRGRVLHRADDDAALDVGDQAQRQDLLAQEVVEGMHVAGDDAQLVVGRAGHRGALHDLGPALHRHLEGLEVVLGRQREFDGAVDLEAEAQLLAVEDGDTALDDAFVFQPFDPPPAGAGGQPDALGDLGDREAGVVLDQIEDAGIDRVLLNFEGEAEGVKTNQVIDTIVKTVPEGRIENTARPEAN